MIDEDGDVEALDGICRCMEDLGDQRTEASDFFVEFAEQVG